MKVTQNCLPHLVPIWFSYKLKSKRGGMQHTEQRVERRLAKAALEAEDGLTLSSMNN